MRGGVRNEGERNEGTSLCQWGRPRYLGRGRLAGRAGSAVLTGVPGDREVAHARGKEGKGIALGLRVVKVVGGTGRRGSVVGRLKGGLSGAAVERAGRVGARSRSEVGVQGRIGSCAASDTARQGVGARGATKVLAVAAATSAERGGSRGEGSRAGRACHGVGTHAVAGVVVHGRRVARIGNHSCASTACTAAQTADVLGKVVVATDLITALPVTGAEGNNTATAHATTSMAHVAVVATVVRRGHHGGRTVVVSVATAHVALRTGVHGRERAAEASRSALEVGETTRGTSPIARTGSVLARRERGQDLGGTVKDSTRRGRDLDGLLVKGASIHAQALGSLEMLLVLPWQEQWLGTYLFVRGEDGKASARGLVLLGSAQRPKGNGSAAKLGEPALQLRLGGVMGKTRHVKHLAALRQEGTNIGASVHGAGENIRVLVGRLRLADESFEHAC
jgi:hypothetical protein